MTAPESPLPLTSAGDPIGAATGADRGPGRPALWALLAVLPFLLFPAAHYAANPSEATGFTTYDLPYYAANARAILTRGAAGWYPNAFDSDPQSPVIYWHWLMGLLAVLMGPLGLDPGVALLFLGIVGAWIAARVMYAVVEAVLEGRRPSPGLYFTTMWGGGVLVLSRALAFPARALAEPETLLALDPGRGLWGLNFGRTLILPTEAVYHALMAGLWLGLLRERWGLAAACLAAVAATHPFTGAQALAIAGAWCAVRGLVERRRPPLAFLLAVAACGAAFGGYYFVYLPSFPAHRELHSAWTLAWTLTPGMMAAAYGPALGLALCSFRCGEPLTSNRRFLMTAAAVSFLLANHHWFISPRQPIHFTRGYIWTPLWLLGLPTLRRMFERLSRSPRGPRWCGLIALGAVVFFDNAAFLFISSGRMDRLGYYLAPEERSAFAELTRRGARGVLLTDDARTGYLAAVDTPLRPYFGHKYNTPHFETRERRVSAFCAGGVDRELLSGVHWVLTRTPHVVQQLAAAGAAPVWTQGDWSLWRVRDE